MKHFSLYQVARSGWQALSPLWRGVILFCLVAGITLRFVNPNKVFWYDEAFTMLRISGYTATEVLQTIPNQQVIEPAFFQPYRQVNPDRGIADTVRGLAIDEPQHTPLYFILARGWAGWFGSAVPTVRLLSVVFSVLAIPAMGWLCWELFGSARTGWIGAALLAVSPFQLVYAQEARPTALWVLTTLLACITLLRALKIRSATTWLIYSIALTVNLYTFLLSGLVLISHALYVLVRQRFRWNLTIQQFALAVAISLVIFAPWLMVIAGNTARVDATTNWLWDRQIPPIWLLKLWLYHATVSFIDRGFLDAPAVNLPNAGAAFFTALRMLVLLTVAWSLVRLCRRTPPSVWLFVLLLTVVPFVVWALPDLLGGQRSGSLRYFVPFYLGLSLAVTHLLSDCLDPTGQKPRWRLWSQGLVLSFLVAGLLSSLLIARSPAWWNKGRHSPLPQVAQRINQTEQPLVAMPSNELGDLITLTYYLDPKVRLLLSQPCAVCSNTPEQQNQLHLPATIPPEFNPVFLYNPQPTPSWLAALQQQQTYPIQTLSEVKTNNNFEYWLWQIIR
jgi:uncharacterized membrane protein